MGFGTGGGCDVGCAADTGGPTVRSQNHRPSCRAEITSVTTKIAAAMRMRTMREVISERLARVLDGLWAGGEHQSYRLSVRRVTISIRPGGFASL